MSSDAMNSNVVMSNGTAPELRLESGDRVLLRGVIESVHDGFVMGRVDSTAPHAIPQRYDLVAVWSNALEPEGEGSVQEHQR